MRGCRSLRGLHSSTAPRLLCSGTENRGMCADILSVEKRITYSYDTPVSDFMSDNRSAQPLLVYSSAFLRANARERHMMPTVATLEFSAASTRARRVPPRFCHPALLEESDR